MATPEAAKHRDLEQRFRNLERAVRDLTSRTLYRPALGVSQGDFIVEGGGSVLVRDGGDIAAEGGGSVVIRDGGGIIATHDNGNVAMRLGPITTGGGNPAEGLLFRDPAGILIMGAYSDNVNGERVALFGSDGTNPLELFQSIAERHYIQSTTGDIQLVVSAGRRVFISHETTAAGANCFINTDGSIWRSTSSLRYKQDVRPAEVDTDAVLALQPREYRAKAEVAELGDDAPTHAGFIAEEAADLGLEQWVLRDDDGQPEAFNYAQFCVAQQAVIQQQAAAIADLTARLEALENAEGTTPDSRKGSTP